MTNDKAISPVIGVILMVAITVILAVVIAALVFNVAGHIQNPPQIPNGYIKNCVAERSNTSAGIYLSCETFGETFPKWIIYANESIVPDKIDNSYNGGIQANNYTVFIPAPYPVDLRVYNAQIYGDLLPLAYEKIL